MKLLPDIDKHGSVTDVLEKRHAVDGSDSKRAHILQRSATDDRDNVYRTLPCTHPFGDKISVSQKIKTTEEKLRLRQLVESIRPKNFGVIVRTSAEGKRVAELNHELKTLLKCWEDTVAKAQSSTVPSLIFEEESRIVSMLRDVFSPSFESIYVNDAETYGQIKKYVDLIAPRSCRHRKALCQG